MEIKVQTDACIGCGKCVKICPFGVIELVENVAVIGDGCTFCKACVEECPVDAITIEGSLEKKAAQNIEDYTGVWVFGEQINGEIQGVVYELIGEGRKLADSLGVPLSVTVLGSGMGDACEELRFYGIDTVYCVDSPELADYRSDVYSRVISGLINKHKPEIVIYGATTIGRSLAPRVAIEVNTGLTADCTGLEIDGDRNLVQTRPAFGGNIMAQILCKHNRPQMATVRHKVMEPAGKTDSAAGEIINETAESADLESKLAFLESIIEEEGAVNLVEADIIVSGGRGIGDPENFNLIKQLADALGGAVGASRAAVDEGWIPYHHQVGQTGKTVKPKIYVACGISGAIQHQVGMRSADCIIAINNDRNAPIFDIAHFGIVADLFEFIPAFIERLEKR